MEHPHLSVAALSMHRWNPRNHHKIKIVQDTTDCFQETLFSRHLSRHPVKTSNSEVSWKSVLKVLIRYLGEPSWKKSSVFKTVLQDTFSRHLFKTPFQDVNASWNMKGVLIVCLVSWKHYKSLEKYFERLENMTMYLEKCTLTSGDNNSVLNNISVLNNNVGVLKMYCSLRCNQDILSRHHYQDTFSRHLFKTLNTISRHLFKTHFQDTFSRR